jgi:cytochrome c peroxidase
MRNFTFLAILASAPLFGEIPASSLRGFAPLPDAIPSASNPLTAAKIELGRMLYYETRLSRSHNISCNSCHPLANFGVDNQPTSSGHKSQKGDRNSPTVYNAAGHIAQFWDGRAATIEEQAKGPVMNPVEMAMPSEEYVVSVLKSIPGYVDAFQRAFPGEPDPVTYDNMAKAIGAFERKLTTPSRWDKFLKGDRSALTSAEQAGFNQFVAAGCGGCHSGAFVGGAGYYKLGLAKPWPNAADPGRFKVTRKEADRMAFKAPSLRNIEKTAPYFHDGSVGSLEDAVKLMAVHEGGRQLDAAQVRSIVAWLKSLTGELPAGYIRQPVLPPSGPKTPKPVSAD